MSMQTLPTELKLLISTLMPEDSIVALRLASKSFMLVEQELYRNITVRQKNIRYLSRTFKERPELARYTRTIRINTYIRESLWIFGADENDTATCIRRILDAVTNATFIKLTGPLYIHSPNASLETSGLQRRIFAYIQKLVISGGFISVLKQDMPQLHILELRKVTIETLNLMRGAKAPRFEQRGVKKLFLEVSGFDASGKRDGARLRDLIDALNCSSVVDLTLEIWKEYKKVPSSVSLRTVLTALHSIAHNIQKFELRLDHDQDFYEGIEDSLTAFTSVSWLTAPTACFFSGVYEEIMENMASRLPDGCNNIVLGCGNKADAVSLLESFGKHGVPANHANHPVLPHAVQARGSNTQLWGVIWKVWGTWNRRNIYDE